VSRTQNNWLSMSTLISRVYNFFPRQYQSHIHCWLFEICYLRLDSSLSNKYRWLHLSFDIWVRRNQ
jgi:hypothetical protein